MNNATPKDIIGRIVQVDLPRLRLKSIAAKVDTGAYYCTLHCHHMQVRNIDGIDRLCFMLLDPTHPEYKDKELRFKNFSQKQIKSSFGDIEKRYIIRTSIRLHGRRIRTWFTLTDRGNMKYPILLGRKMLKNKFVVDVALNELKPKTKS